MVATYDCRKNVTKIERVLKLNLVLRSDQKLPRSVRDCCTVFSVTRYFIHIVFL